MPAPIRGFIGALEIGEELPVKVSGIVNLSPESFYKGSISTNIRDALKCAGRILDEGADAIDVGAMSTAPYLSGLVSAEVEEERLVPAIKAISSTFKTIVTADTQRGGVADAALRAGAMAINDVSGGRDKTLLEAVADRDASIILLPRMPKEGGNPVRSLMTGLRESVEAAVQAGIDDSKIIVDPGIGFYRCFDVPWYERDMIVLSKLKSLNRLGKPVYLGVSRKSFIAKITGAEEPEKRLSGSIAAVALAVANGASMIRAHDVLETVQAVKIAECFKAASKGPKKRAEISTGR